MLRDDVPLGIDMGDILKIAGQMVLMALAAAAFVMIVLPFNGHAAARDGLPEAKRPRSAL